MKILSQIILAIILLVIGGVIGYLINNQSTQQLDVIAEPTEIKEVRQGWVKYEDPDGWFSFEIPEDRKVSSVSGEIERQVEGQKFVVSTKQITIVAKPNSENDTPLPDMNILVESGIVEFRLYELLDWKDFEGVVSSFELERF